MNFLYTILIFLALAGNDADNTIDFSKLTSTTCPYETIVVDYPATPHWIPGMKSTYEDFRPDYIASLEKYLPKDVINSLFFGWEWKAAMANELNERYKITYNFDAECILPSAIYRFKDIDDLLLVKCEPSIPADRSGPPPPSPTFYFFFHKNKPIPIFWPTVEEAKRIFNSLVDQSTDLRNADVLCKALLLLFMKYHNNTIFVLESDDDILTALVMHDYIYKSHHPGIIERGVKIQFVPDIYYSDLSDIPSEVMDSFNITIKNDPHLLNNYNSYQSKLAENSVKIESIRITEELYKNTISLFIFIPHKSKIAQWNIIFSDDGHVIDMEHVCDVW